MRTERWVPRDGGFDAVKITRENLEEAAKWCGGEIGTRSKPTDLNSAYDTVLRFPTLEGPEEAAIGDYLIRKDDGKFDFWPESAMLAKYKKVGQRQDGLQTGVIKTAMRGGREFDGQIMNNTETEAEYRTRLGW